MLYEAKTRKKYYTQKKSNKDNISSSEKFDMVEVLNNAFDNGVLKAFMDKNHTVYCIYKPSENETQSVYELNSYELKLIIQKLMLKEGQLLRKSGYMIWIYHMMI